MAAEPNYYAIIPAEVRYDKDLPANAKLLYGEITSLANKSGYCFAGNSYFADLYGVSERQITRLLNSLKKKGYIFIEQIEGKGRKIYVSHDTAPLTKMSIPPDKNVGGTPDKNVTHNNTSINNKINNIYTPEFEKWYARYPNKFNKQQTFKNWKTALKSYSVKDLYTALLNYEKYLQKKRVNQDYITRSTNFLGKKVEFIGWLETANNAKPLGLDFVAPEQINASDEITNNPDFLERMRRFNSG